MSIIYPPRNYRKWEAVCHAGDPCNELCIVLGGALKLSRLCDGPKSASSGYTGQGVALGLVGALAGWLEQLED